MGLSNLGIFHTIIGVIAIVTAIVSYIRYGKINLSQLSGKVYFYGTLITSLTALGLSKNGFNIGHVFSVVIILLVSVAYFLYWSQSLVKTMHFQCKTFSCYTFL